MSPPRKRLVSDICRRHHAQRCSPSTRKAQQSAQRESPASISSTCLVPVPRSTTPCAVPIGTCSLSSLSSELWLFPPSDEIADRPAESPAITPADPSDRHPLRTALSIRVPPHHPFRP